MASWQEDVQNALNEIAGAITGGELAVTLSAPIEADIIDADMTAITGALTGSASSDMLGDLFEQAMWAGGVPGSGPAVSDMLSTLTGMASYGIEDILYELGGGSIVQELNMGSIAQALVAGSIPGAVADQVADLNGAGLSGPSVLVDQTGSIANADLLFAIYTNDAGAIVSQASPLFDTVGGDSLGDHFGAIGGAASATGNVHAQLRYLAEAVNAIKVQTDKFVFDGSNRLKVETTAAP